MIVQATYITQIYRGISPVPPIRDWKALFRDGFSFSVIVGLGYSIIPLLIGILTVILPLSRVIDDIHSKNLGDCDPQMVHPHVNTNMRLVINNRFATDKKNLVGNHDNNSLTCL